MQRTIKFRFWNKKKKEWLDLSYDAHMNPLTGKIMFDEDNSCSDPECCGGPSPCWVDNDDYIPCQWTGLLDKNGVPIYEGDVVQGKPPDFIGICTGIVKYGGLCFYFEGETTGIRTYAPEDRKWKFYVTNDTVKELREIEVIGNTFEHNHLLENK